jgi:hypothetical protein
MVATTEIFFGAESFFPDSVLQAVSKIANAKNNIAMDATFFI